MGKAYSEALALESIGEIGEYDQEKEVYNNVSSDDLERYARTVAYKTAHNISNGHKMDESNNPLKFT